MTRRVLNLSALYGVGHSDACFHVSSYFGGPHQWLMTKGYLSSKTKTYSTSQTCYSHPFQTCCDAIVNESVMNKDVRSGAGRRNHGALESVRLLRHLIVWVLHYVGRECKINCEREQWAMLLIGL